MTNSAPISNEIFLKTSRFGTISVEKENIFVFPEGMIGFKMFSRFLLLPHGKDDGFFWLQSMDDLSLAFPLADPSLFVGGVKFQIPEQETISLKILNENDVKILVVATIPKEIKKELWLNLQAPIIINQSNGLAKQVILDAISYPLRFKVNL